MRGADTARTHQDVMKPPGTGFFNDAYLVYELMDTDLHQVIRSSQPLSGASCELSTRGTLADSPALPDGATRQRSDDHIQYFLYQARFQACAVCIIGALIGGYFRRRVIESRSCCAA